MATTPCGGVGLGQKRRRTERNFVRDTNLWMEDGNIIIATSDTDESEPTKEEMTYVFKCHRSILSKQSKVFEGLLGIPPSTETQDMYDGLPLVMLPDAYRDVKKLLAYLYEPGEIAYAPGPHLWELEKMCEVLEELQGPLRLAAKYEFTKLHSLIGRTLEFMWPTTLDHWDARCDWEERNCDSDAWEPEHTPWAGHAVNLGYEARLLSIVPCAFYFLSRQLPQLISQYTSPSFKGEGHKPYIMMSVHSLLDGLAPPQFCQLIAGHQLLSRTTRNIISSALPTITLYCVDCARAPQSADLRRKRKGEGKTPCASTIARWWKENTPTITGSRLRSAAQIVFYDPLKTLEELRDTFGTSMKDPDYHESNPDGICDCCQIGVETALQRLRQYFWDDLPYAFSVKPRNPDIVYGYKRYIQEYFTYCSNYD